MKTLVIVAAILFSGVAHAESWMRVSEIFAPSSTVYVAKSDCENSGQQCVKVDGVDLEVVDLVNGTFVVNQTKLAAKESRLAQEKALADAQALAQVRLDSADLSKITTVAGLKALVQDLILLRKGKP